MEGLGIKTEEFSRLAYSLVCCIKGAESTGYTKGGDKKIGRNIS